MNFGEFVRQLRIDRRLGLRECCLELGVDPSNWSKLERGLVLPPKHREILERWADFFQLAADKRQEFSDLAALGRGELPADVASDGRALAALPEFLRALRGSEPQISYGLETPHSKAAHIPASDSAHQSSGAPTFLSASEDESTRPTGVSVLPMAEMQLPQNPEPVEVRPRPQGNRLRSQAQRRMLLGPS